MFLPLLAYVMLQFAENVVNLHCTKGLLFKNGLLLLFSNTGKIVVFWFSES